jgi:hypothetical protein
MWLSSGGASCEESDASMQLSASAPYDCTLLLSSDIGENAAGLDLSLQRHAIAQS